MILVNILLTIWWMNVIPGTMDQFDTKIDFVKYMWVSDLHFVVQWFWPSFCKTYLMDECSTWDNQSIWHEDWPHKILYVGQWPIHVFCGPVILLNILTVWWRNIILGIIDECDTKIGLISYIWVSDLYFKVQWFCLISWRSTVTVNYFDT